ncbi:MAG TPA: outer membrane protein assembly factor BamD [Flavobacteriales bacterium]|nr:outer membrane protein assembly factor BamD [Flavobacteriales bacterium]
MTLFAVSCGTKESTHKIAKAIPLKKQIKTAESKLSGNNPSKSQLLDLISLYRQYADSFPNDKRSPVYLIKAGDFYGNVNLPHEKCAMYKKVVDLYPDFKDADMVLYLYASTLDSDLDNRAEAKKQYELFVQKFPQSPYAQDAIARLTTIDSLSFNELQEKIIRQQLRSPK